MWYMNNFTSQIFWINGSWSNVGRHIVNHIMTSYFNRSLKYYTSFKIGCSFTLRVKVLSQCLKFQSKVWPTWVIISLFVAVSWSSLFLKLLSFSSSSNSCFSENLESWSNWFSKLLSESSFDLQSSSLCRSLSLCLALKLLNIIFGARLRENSQLG